MSTSVVEVWQPEDADPLVPVQVSTFLFLPLVCLIERGNEKFYAKRTAPKNSIEMPDARARVRLAHPHCCGSTLQLVNVSMCTPFVRAIDRIS